MNILERASEIFAAGGISGPEAFWLALDEMVLDLKWALPLEALDEDPMEPDYEALGSVEPESWYADSRDSAEAPAIQ